MQKVLRWTYRIVLFLAAVVILTVLRELVLWFQFFREFGMWAAWLYVGAAAALVAYFVVLPLWRIFTLPSFGMPLNAPTDRQKRQALERRGRLLGLTRHDVKQRSDAELMEHIQREVAARRPEADALRRKYVTAVFIGTAASQSAVIDLFLVVSAALKLTWKTLQLYGARVPLHDTLAILKDIAISGAVGASELAETGSNLLVQIFMKGGAKLPGLNIITESAADGFVNGYLVCRIGLVTENYCTIAYTDASAHWKPSAKAVSRTLTDVLQESRDQILKSFGPVYGGAVNLFLGWLKTEVDPAEDRQEESKNYLNKLTEFINKWRSGPETT
ncbi:YcjF family protein [bacterium]|nr:YcjF family protein [bacterium]